MDNILWKSPQQYWEAAESLTRRGYRAQPLWRVYIVKRNGKLRPLGIPTMKDRAMQALYVLALEPIVECHADPNSYGFRPYKAAAKSIREKLGGLLRESRSIPYDVLLSKLSRLLRGWGDYHRLTCSSRMFGKVHHWLLEGVWRWIKR